MYTSIEVESTILKLRSRKTHDIRFYEKSRNYSRRIGNAFYVKGVFEAFQAGETGSCSNWRPL